jgi:hypothetical protein
MLVQAWNANVGVPSEVLSYTTTGVVLSGAIAVKAAR